MCMHACSLFIVRLTLDINIFAEIGLVSAVLFVHTVIEVIQAESFSSLVHT